MSAPAKPTVYIVTPEHIAGEELNDFLRKCIAKEFAGRSYKILSESCMDRLVHYSSDIKKIASFLVEVGGEPVSIFFDITAVSSTFKYA